MPKDIACGQNPRSRKKEEINDQEVGMCFNHRLEQCSESKI
jgi:hypothetical protein